jgi:hypothetical protein
MLAAVRERIEAARGDDFCDPERRTPADIFGRVRGRHSLTAANVAPADAWHGLVIFNEHDPLVVDGERLADALAVARAWAARAHATDPQARHLFVLWNCLWRAGASRTHGHLQVLLGRSMAQARVELWHAAVRRYARETGRDYFADLTAAHLALGLGQRRGPIVVFASLTPIKEREVVFLAPGQLWADAGTVDSEADTEALLVSALADVVALYRQQGALALNLAISGPPLGGAADWEGFPTIARLVDRGDPLSPVADMAAMEFFGSSVVATDPFALARALATQGTGLADERAAKAGGE